MAIKRFDDIDKKARELEAQAKKLRREKQAAKTKAYADALVAVFPEVKAMRSPARGTTPATWMISSGALRSPG